MSFQSPARRHMSACALAMLLYASSAFAQAPLLVPQVSPKATVSQTIGITDVTITYHRPGVKNRKIWGALVPYNEVWRAGANENTTISFQDPVKVEGKNLPAGTYGLHMIPTEKTWTVIFSNNSTSWGSFFYKQTEDALRVVVQPEPAEHQEYLSYEFDDVSTDSAVVALRWEKLRVPVRISVDTKANVLADARDNYLRGSAAFTWQGFNQAAAYCLQNNINLDEGLTWAEKSISMNENLTNLSVKAGLLEKQGKTAEANTVRERSMKIATTEADFNIVGYQLLGTNKTKEAIDVFRKNAKQHPDSWNVYDSLAEAYEKNGDTKLAIENYTKALALVKDADNKKRIGDEVKRLSGK